MNNVFHELGTTVASILDPRDLGIVAIPGTPLYNLVSAYNTYKAPQAAVMNDSQSGVTIQNGVVTPLDFTTGENLFNSNFDTIVKIVSSATRNHISFAKNVVSPVITAMADAVSKSIGEKLGAAPNFEVIVKDLPEPLLDSSLQSTMEREAKNSSLMPESFLRLPDMDSDAVFVHMQTGSSGLDSAIGTWGATLGMGFFKEIYDNLFLDPSERKDVYTVRSFSEIVNEKEHGLDAALTIYLLCANLESNIPENTPMDLAKYKDIVSQYRQAAIETLYRGLVEAQNRMKSGNLVISTNRLFNNNLSITVFGPSYRTWLETGGKPEHLAGMVLSEDINYTAASIDARRSELELSWNRYALLQETINKNTAISDLIHIVEQEFKYSLENPYSDEIEFLSKPNMKEKILDLFYEQYRDVINQNQTDIFAICMKLLCRTRFFYTDSEKILQSMLNVQAANPTVTPREAATIATIEYVSDYVASMMKLS